MRTKNIQIKTSKFSLLRSEKEFYSLILEKYKREGPLSSFSKTNLKQAQKIWRDLSSSFNKVFIFAFGGAGHPAKIALSLFPYKKGKAYLISDMDPQNLNNLLAQTKEELRNCGFLFLSKSGSTSEVIFYKSFLQNIYHKKKLSFKKRITVLTQARKSPLLSWIQKQEGNVVFLKDSLPGRFSFFTLSGLVQLRAFGINYAHNEEIENHFPNRQIEFFIHHFDKIRELFLIPFDPRLNELAHYMELCYSESLFKQETEKLAPALRSLTLPDLRHAMIEELMAKKNQAGILALDIDKNTYPQWEGPVKKLLNSSGISYLYIKIPHHKNSLALIMQNFYKIIFCMGALAKVDIYKQSWVDFLKNINS